MTIGKHYFKLTDSKPLFAKPYRIPESMSSEIDKEIKDLLQRGLICPSKSRYASPAFPLMKKNGSVRLIVDYRNLNKVTEKEVFPFLNI